MEGVPNMGFVRWGGDKNRPQRDMLKEVFGQLSGGNRSGAAKSYRLFLLIESDKNPLLL